MTFSLAGFAASLGVKDPENFASKCEFLRNLLVETNRQVNLTRITGFDEFNIKHAADSLLIASVYPQIVSEKLHIADIGCGAGFPSLILALAFPELQIVSIDSTGKKIAFVSRAASELGLKNLTAIQGRAVELNRKAEFQRRFDIITARAVAPSPSIYRETSLFARKNGRWIFYKTPGQAADELPELQKVAAKNLVWRVSEELPLPDDSGSRVFVSGEQK